MNPDTTTERRPNVLQLERDSTLNLLFSLPLPPDPKNNIDFYDHVKAGRSSDALQLLSDNLVAVDSILDINGNAALHLVLGRDVEDLEEQYVEMAKHLISKKCSWNIKNNVGKTALWLGISKGHVKVLLLLLDKKVRELTLDKLLEEVVVCMKDEDEKVRANAVYTIATMFEKVESVSYATGILTALQGLYLTLGDTSIEVCKRSCKALHNFAARCGRDAIANPPYSNKLFDHLATICENLLTASLRTDWPNNRRHAVPYEALVKVIQNAPLTKVQDVQKLLMGAITHLETIFKTNDAENNNTAAAAFVPYHPTNTDANLATTTTTTTTTNNNNNNYDTEDIQNSLLSALCSGIEVCVQKIPLADLIVNDLDDRIMHCLLQMFNVRGESRFMVYEDALLAISAVIEKFGTKMTRYITILLPVIQLVCLQSPKETKILKLSVGVVGDLCRALKRDMLPYYHHCDDIVRRVMELLDSSNIDRSFNLAVIDLFGCMALNLERDFDRYVFLVLDLLKSFGSDLMKTDEPNHEEKHGEGQQEQSDEETEYLDKLRTGLLECYSAIIQGLRVSKRHDLVLSAMDTIHHLLQHCAEHFATAAASADADSDKKASWECKKAAWGLLLDVGQTYGLCNNQSKKIFLQPFVLDLIDIGQTGKKNDRATSTKTVGDGLPRTLGTRLGYTNLYYCGRRLGRQAIPGSDGQCGPTNGPQCTDCIKYQQAQGYVPPTIPDDNRLAADHMRSIVLSLQCTALGIYATAQTLVPTTSTSVPGTFGSDP